MSDPIVDALAASRDRTFAIVAHLDDGQLERQIDPIMSPLAWDLGHIAAYEDLWLVHRFADEPLLRPELAARYDAFETPRAVRGEIELLDADGAREYLAEVRERTLAAIDAHGVDPVVHEMVIRHELQHTETMRQAMRLGGVLAQGEPALQTFNGGAPSEWLDVPAGPATIGAPDGLFSYDNERPRHAVELGA
ncbi:MAG TPA: DinB family protein, partial [Caldimonas sp.]|nr:DinB family protein [Caldimonas sp.]